MEKQEDVFTNGTSAIKYIDTKNIHPYDELDIDEDANDQIVSAQVKPDPAVGAVASVAQVLGSAIGRALAPNNQLLQVAAGTLAGTVASAIGQKFGQVLSASLTQNATQISLDGVFNGFGLNLGSAAAGSVASLITAELGTALGLHGYGAQLFDAGVGGVASQVATQLVQKGGLSALNAIDWTQALEGGAASLGGAVGSILGSQIVHAESQAGAIGGQLLGAIGSAIGASFVIGQSLGFVLDFVIPGIGSLIGTVLGTVLGDAFGPSTPHPASTHIVDWSGAHYTDRLYTAVEGGQTDTSKAMADAAAGVVNSYLDAVQGAALDHGKQVMIGYQTEDQSRPYFSGWLPGAQKYATAQEAVFAAALDVLHNTEVIGGDLLLKRAHAGSVYSDTSVLAGDLQVAQDYENYLNNKEAINALMAANPNSAFTAGWIATFARVNDLGLNHANASDFLGGMVGWLDSVKKAGLVFDGAGVTYNQTGNTALIDIKVANGTFVPGALSVFADQLTETSDAGGTTLHFVLNNGLLPLGFRGPASSTLVSGDWQVTGGAGNNLWFGSDATSSTFTAVGNGNDILIGGSTDEHIHAGEGWNFVDGGAGNDWITSGSGNDILRGGRGIDRLEGGGGNDTYTFSRGDGADTVFDDVTVTATTTTWNDWTESGDGYVIFHHDPVTTTTTTHSDAGADTLTFGPGITPADISVQGNGADVIVAVKDPAHPGVAFAQLADRITLTNWTDPLDRIENLVFADGTVVSITDSAALAAHRVPFGAALSGNIVIENAANGTMVGMVTGYDLDSGVRLHYALVNDAGGRFAINAMTGAISVANGLLLDYETAQSWQVTVRTLDDASYAFDNTFTIAVADVPEAPVGAVLSGGSVAENAANGTPVGTVAGVDPDPHAVLGYSLSDNAGGRFAINGSTGAITVANGLLLDYEAATSHQITVRTSDQSGHVFDKAFTIAVTDVPEAPVDAVLSGGSVAENAANGTPVGTVAGVDPDPHAVLGYSLSDNAGGRFAINGSTGAITVANGLLLDYEAATSHQITVRTSDQNGHVFDKAFTIAVTDVTEISVIEGSGSTGLTTVDTIYHLGSGGAGPTLKYLGATVTAGTTGAFAPVATERTATGYEVAWKNPGADQYVVWNTDADGNFQNYQTAVMSGSSLALEALETSFQQDLNSDGIIGIPFIEGFGATGLAVADHLYYLLTAGAGPTLKDGGAAVGVGQSGAFAPVSVERIAGGYEVAWKNPDADQYIVWSTDANGNHLSNLTGVVSGSSLALEQFETSFQQDLNSDGIIGIPFIEGFGSTGLAVADHIYYLLTAGAGPSLKYFGAAVGFGQTGSFVPVAAEHTATGYEVAWKNPGADQYLVWNTDADGNFQNYLTGVVSGSSLALEQFETSFQQDLNSDGIVGVPFIEGFGSTGLAVADHVYYLLSGGAGPTLKYFGAAVGFGQTGSFVPVAAEHTATGYEVAWKTPGADQYLVWNTDADGNFQNYLTGVVSGSSLALEQLETSFQQDLNSDGIIGIPFIEGFGSTGLAVADHIYYLLTAGSGPTLKYFGAAVGFGQTGSFVPIAAEQTASGYDVAWKATGADQYLVWNTDADGNFQNYLTGVVPGNSADLKSLEGVFHQDLNGDGVIGGSPVILDLDGNGVDVIPLNASHAAFDMDGAAGREHTAWAGAGDGILAIDLGAGGTPGPDGAIDQAAEIVFAQWWPGATSDMAALRFVFDTDHNGRLDSGDARWSEFRIWQDANGDGVSQAGEVKTLDALGIASIGLEPNGAVTGFADGSAIKGVAGFTRTDGTTGTAGDVSLAYQAGAADAAELMPALAWKPAALPEWHIA